jgi:hypothetical protein
MLPSRDNSNVAAAYPDAPIASAHHITVSYVRSESERIILK